MEKSRKSYRYKTGLWMLQAMMVWAVIASWWNALGSFLSLQIAQSLLYVGLFMFSVFFCVLLECKKKNILIVISTVLLVLLFWREKTLFMSAVNVLANAFLKQYYTAEVSSGIYQVPIKGAGILALAFVALSIPVIVGLAYVLKYEKGKIIVLLFLMSPFVTAAAEMTFPSVSSSLFLLISGGLFFANIGYKSVPGVLRKSVAAVIALLIVVGISTLAAGQMEQVKSKNHKEYLSVQKNVQKSIADQIRAWTLEREKKEKKQKEKEEQKKEQKTTDRAELIPDNTEKTENTENLEGTENLENNVLQGVLGNSDSLAAILDDSFLPGIGTKTEDRQSADMSRLKALSYFEPGEGSLGTLRVQEKPEQTVYQPVHYGGRYDGASWSQRPASDKILPEDEQKPDTAPRLTALCAEHAAGSVGDAEALIRREFEANTTYNYHPGSTPPEKDFAEYFLFDNKKGFCVHFATTATLMYRMYGYPARYVDGYAIKASAFQQQADGSCEAKLTGDMGHAWCEVNESGSWVVKEHTLSYQGTTLRKMNPPAVSENVGGMAAHKGLLMVGVFFLALIAAGISIWTGIRRKRRNQLLLARNGVGVQNIYLAFYQRSNFQTRAKKQEDLLSRETLCQMKQTFSNISDEDWEWMYQQVMDSMFSSRSVEQETLEKMYSLYQKEMRQMKKR